jgi:aminoglycoside phosphotransferase (APT) family kinase protein
LLTSVAIPSPLHRSLDWLGYVIQQQEQIIRHTSNEHQLVKELEKLHHFRNTIFQTLSQESNDQFVLHCDDFGAGNILVDGEYNIVGLADWEFTYTAPKEYECCMLSWLILSKPYDWTIEDAQLYSKHLQLFLEILEDVESNHSAKSSNRSAKHALSTTLRESWSNGTFWLMLCARNGLYFNELWQRFNQHRVL